MTEQSEHLSDAQVENYGKRTSDAGAESAARDEPQHVNDQRFDDRRLQDQRVDDQHFHGQSLDDQNLDDRRVEDQRVEDPRGDDPQGDDQRLEDHRIEAHLADCPSCRNRLLDFHRTHFALLSEPADPKLRTAPTPECPSDDALRELAAGLTPDAIATKLTQHAATCDHCGPLLRTFTEDFSDDFTREEQAALANLQSSSAAWQKNTARQMLEAGGASAAAVSASKSDKKLSAERPATSALDRKPFFWKWALVPATAAVVAVAVFSIWYTQRDTPEKVERLLAQAYTEQRTIEMRWPGPAWAPVKGKRAANSVLDVPLSLLDAENAIERQHVDGSSTESWMQVSARADILNWQPQLAIEKLTRLSASHPQSIALKLDLAIAYFQQGEVTGDSVDYEKSLAHLNDVLRQDSSNHAALYDRAVAIERLGQTQQAIQAWHEYLQIENNPAWSADAQMRLSRLH